MIIHPEELVAKEIFRIIKLRAGNDIIEVAKGHIQAVATRIHEESVLAGVRLKIIHQEHGRFPFRIVAIARGINTLIPGGEDMLMPGDHAFFMASRENLNHLMGLAGIKQEKRQLF